MILYGCNFQKFSFILLYSFKSVFIETVKISETLWHPPSSQSIRAALREKNLVILIILPN
jgi:hypothetical protein